MNNFHIIIPARLQSSRFPGKLLKEVHGKSVLERTYQQAQLANPKSITIATDDESIASHAKEFGATIVMTSDKHQSGTDRIAEVIAKGGVAKNEIIVNVQGDEPFISPLLIQQVANSLDTTTAPMATLCWPIESLEQFQNPNVVKVVSDANQHALYFSRSPIPTHRDDKDCYSNSFRHIGLYAYRASFLLEFVQLPVCKLEQLEALEQLRVLWAGFDIKVERACVEPLQDINTPEDLELALDLYQHPIS